MAIEVGDWVRVGAAFGEGEVVEVRGGHATVDLNGVRTQAPLSLLRPATRPQTGKGRRRGAR